MQYEKFSRMFRHVELLCMICVIFCPLRHWQCLLGCRDVGEGEALIQPAAGLCPVYGASVHGGEAVTVGSA
jgi:hypothetical protein